MGYAVYVLASRMRGTLYVGVTRYLARRLDQHRSLAVPGFTRTYRVNRLVHFEQFDQIDDAIAREKQLKGWNREWKIKLIERSNPHWDEVAPPYS